MPGLLTEKYSANSVTERRELRVKKYAYDLHTVHNTILQKRKKTRPISHTAIIFINYTTICRPGSSVGSYGLDGPGIECRWGARLSAPLQTGPGAHSASCAMGTGSFPGVKSGQGVLLTPHPF